MRGKKTHARVERTFTRTEGLQRVARKTHLFLFSALFGVVGAVFLVVSFAATPADNAIEPENGVINGNALKATDTNASNQQYVSFQAPAGCPAGQVGTPPNCTTPSTLPPGSTLPDDATCSARVVKTAEVRPQNVSENATAGHNKGLAGTYRSRVDGNFTGTTDEIIQWTACKWGIDSNIVRAQAMMESYWKQHNNYGDWTTDGNSCPHPSAAYPNIRNHGINVDDPVGHPNQCPESYSMIQNRWNYFGQGANPPINSWPEVEDSTAYALDLAYSSWRDCFEGNYDWLNTQDHTGTYAAGDAWGCVGVWFAGRWKTDPANTYIGNVQNYFNNKSWLDPNFINWRG